MVCYFLLHGIFPTQGLNSALLHCRQILYHLIHQGSPMEHQIKIYNQIYNQYNQSNCICNTCYILPVLLFSCSVMSNCFTIPLTVAHQSPLSMGFHRQEYWSGLPFPSPGNLPNPRSKPLAPALADGFFSIEPSGKPCNMCNKYTVYVFLNEQSWLTYTQF